MTDAKLSPREELWRWVAQLKGAKIRNVESVFRLAADNGEDKPRTFRGFRIRDDLLLTRQRAFFHIGRTEITALSLEEVAANYVLDDLQESYRSAIDHWTNARKRKERQLLKKQKNEEA